VIQCLETFPRGVDGAMIGEIGSLNPAFRMAVDQILLDMRAKGWDAVIGSGMRTMPQQAALFAQGRESLDKVNRLRRQAGLPPTTEKENKKPVTHARPGKSNHNLTTALLYSGPSTFEVMNGYAVDIVSRVYGWDPDKRFWADLGTLARQYGCEWGGDWKGNRYDPAHIQMKIVDSAPRSSTVV
jgi:hypothetical protein